MKDIEENVRNILNEIHANIPENPNTDLFAAGILDSLATARLIARIESQYNIELNVEDIVPENFASISGIVSLLKVYIKDES